MSWPRESLLLVILALSAPWACADTLTVNTRTDDFADNELCSLREAVAYFNRDNPEGSFQGCVAETEGGSASITLPATEEPYLIEGSAIVVGKSMTISGGGRRDDAVSTVQVTGPHRAFVLNFNRQHLKPRCAQTVTPSCASNPASFDLEPLSDTEVVGDYLTTVHTPLINGILPAVVLVPPATLPSHSYLIRIYDNPAEGEPVEVGRTKVSLAITPMPWQVRISTLLRDGVHQFTYTVEKVETLNNSIVEAESAPSTDTLTVAIYTAPALDTITITQLVLRGGCGTATGCATDVDDNTDITNDPDPANTGYDPYALSYTNGLTGTDGNGGIIFNNEGLALTDVLIRDGEATLGGAIYSPAASALAIAESEFRDNRAGNGAALYNEANTILLGNSLVTANTASQAGGAALAVGTAPMPSGLLASSIVNSTFSENAGHALLLRDGAIITTSTIVLNTAGGLDAVNEDVDVYNTILAGNGAGTDCQNLPLTAAFTHNLVLIGGGCPAAGNQVISGALDTDQQLMAELVDGRCTSRYGLLCPLADHGGSTWVHMPRVLEDYIDDPSLIDASPIINKGADSIGGTDPESCSPEDQRGESRLPFSCDIGAVEVLGVASGTSTRSGGVIVHGEEYSQYMGDDLADEGLLPAAKCPAGVTLTFSPAAPAIFPPPTLASDPTLVVPDSYRSDFPGCPWLVRAPSRGVVTFQADGGYNYRPSSAFHGFDRFDFRVVTTLSNLNALANDRSRLVRAQVIVEPATTVTSSKLSGTLDIWTLLMLGALGLGWRRGGKA